MQVPVELGLDPSVVIPPSTDTEHESTEPTIAPKAQLAPEDRSHLKNPPEWGMQVPVEPGLDPSLVILSSTETEHDIIEPTIASESQLATAFISKKNVATIRRLGKLLPTRAAKSAKLTSTSMSDSKPASNQTKTDSSVDDEDDDIHEAVGTYDSDYQDIPSYDVINTIMPRFKPIDDWNKDIDVEEVIDIFASSLERHKKDTKDDFEWVNHRIQPTKKEDIIQAYESSFSFIDGFIPSDTLMSQSKFCITNVLVKKWEGHRVYECVLDHPLCNIPMDIDWLFKPVSHTSG